MATLAIIAAILVIPLWLVELPPMEDFPGHAAILFIQTHAGSASFLSHIYRVEWAPIPDLASEVLVPLIPASTTTAIKIFLSASLVLWVMGPAAVQYALMGRLSPTITLAAFFAYNLNFMMGFINYMFAAGVSFFVVAAWFATIRRPWFERLIMLSLMLTAAYFLHLLAMVFAVVVVGGFEIADIKNHWRTTIAKLGLIAVAAMPAMLFLLLFPAGHSSDGEVRFSLLKSLPIRVASLNWLGFAPEALALLGVIAWALASGRAKLGQRMAVPLVILLVICLLVPVSLYGGWGLHVRFPAIAMAILVASLMWPVGRHAARAILWGAIVFCMVDAVSLVWLWQGPSAQIQEMRAALESLAPGAKLVVAVDNASKLFEDDYIHAPEYAVIDRQVFDPLVFTQAGQHIVHLVPGWRALAAATLDQSNPVPLADLNALAEGGRDQRDIVRLFPYLLRWDCHFDDLLLIHFHPEQEAVPRLLQPLSAGQVFTLYRISHEARCPTSGSALHSL